MPSTQLFTQSGGITLLSGNIFSGSYMDLLGQGCKVGGVQLHLAQGAPSLVYVCLPNLSGSVGTSVSGGSLSSGGLADGMELTPGRDYFIPRVRLLQCNSGLGLGIEAIRVDVPAAASGGRLFWELF